MRKNTIIIIIIIISLFVGFLFLMTFLDKTDQRVVELIDKKEVGELDDVISKDTFFLEEEEKERYYKDPLKEIETNDSEKNILKNNEEIIDLIKKAYYEDGSIFCEFIQPEEEWLPEEKNYLSLKKGKIFVEITSEHEDYYVIIKDGTVYVWSLEEETGLKFNITEHEILEIPFFTNLEDPEAFEKSVIDYQIECQKIDIQDSVFEVPKDVLF